MTGFRRGASVIRDAAGEGAGGDSVGRERSEPPTRAKRHPLRDPVFAGYFVHGFAAFCPRCWGTTVGGWDGCLFPWDEELDPACWACRPICEACWIGDPWPDESDHVHEAPVPMLTLYTAGLADRPPRSREQAASWVGLVRKLGWTSRASCAL